MPRLRGLFFVRGLTSSRGIPGPAGPNRIKAANSSGTGRDHDARENSSFARPGPVAPSKNLYVSKARKRRASGRRGPRRYVRGPASVPRPCRPPTKWERAACGDGPPRGIIQASGFANPDHRRRSGQFPDAPKKSNGELLTF